MRLATLLAATALVVLAPPAAGQTNPVPSWSIGDTWDYHVSGTHAGPEGPRPFAYVGKSVVAGKDTIRVGDADVEAFRVVDVSHDVPPGSEAAAWAGAALDYGRGARFAWFSVDGLLTVKRAGYHVDAEGRPHRNAEISYAKPCNEQGYPHLVGSTTTDDCVQEGISNGQPFRSEYRPFSHVQRRESVTVPAGTFDAFVLEVGVETPEGRQAGETQYYVEEVCSRVRTDGVPGNDVHLVLLGYRCGARSGGSLTTFDPPLDPATLQLPADGVPAPTVAALVGAIGFLAIAARVKP